MFIKKMCVDVLLCICEYGVVIDDFPHHYYQIVISPINHFNTWTNFITDCIDCGTEVIVRINDASMMRNTRRGMSAS